MRRRQARSKKVISVRVSPLQKAPYEPRVVAERDSRTATPNRAAVAAIGLLWPGIQRPEPGASRWFSGQKDARGGNQHGRWIARQQLLIALHCGIPPPLAVLPPPLAGKVRIHIFNIAGQWDTGARGGGREAGSISAVLLSRSEPRGPGS